MEWKGAVVMPTGIYDRSHLPKRVMHPNSREAIRKALLGKKQPPEVVKKRADALRGTKKTEEDRRGISQRMMGNKHGLGHRHTEETRRLMSEKARRGSASNFWKGGTTEEAKLIRQSAEYRLWRRAVFERDDYVCQICGQRGGRLHPDHIKRFSHFPELRFDVSNGRTLCEPCHKQTPTYGRRKSVQAFEDDCVC
jgi:hypothetical protein